MKIWKRILAFLAVVGPGILVMVSDNDAPGLAIYLSTGTKYGFSLLWLFILLIPVCYYTMEMAMRAGIVTGKGHSRMILDYFGPFWGYFSLIDLVVLNFLTLLAEYLGMTIGAQILGIPPIITVLTVTAILFFIIVTGKYWTFEKIALFFCIFNVLYVPLAFLAMKSDYHPAWSEILKGFYGHSLIQNGINSELIFVILANWGTTIAAWMLYFLQGSVVDKRLTKEQLTHARIDLGFGSIVTAIVAISLIVVTGSLFYSHDPKIEICDIKESILTIVPIIKHSNAAKGMLALGLFDAGLLGALCITLSSSWAIGESLQMRHSLNSQFREAWPFYVIYLTMLLAAGGISLIPGLPVDTISSYSQVISVTLMPILLVFLLIVTNNVEIMKEHKNSFLQNVMNWGITISLIVISTILCIQILFPGKWCH